MASVGVVSGVAAASFVGCTDTDSTAPDLLDGRDVPYFLLVADEWRLTGAATKDLLPDDSLRLIWTLSYENSAGPLQTTGAALAVVPAPPDAGALVAKLDSGSTRVSVGDRRAYAAEEHSRQDGHLIATHVLWDDDEPSSG